MNLFICFVDFIIVIMIKKSNSSGIIPYSVKSRMYSLNGWSILSANSDISVVGIFIEIISLIKHISAHESIWSMS